MGAWRALSCLGYFLVTGSSGRTPGMQGCVHNNLQSYSGFSTILKTIPWLLAALNLKITRPSKVPCPSLSLLVCTLLAAQLLSPEQSPARCPSLSISVPLPSTAWSASSRLTGQLRQNHSYHLISSSGQRPLSSHPQYCMNGIIPRVPWVSQLGCEAQKDRSLPVLPLI